MDLRCGCCGGEISWASPEVLENAPKEEVIIFTCLDCKCGYDTSASRTHRCGDFNKRDFGFQTRQHGIPIENEDKMAYKQAIRINESNRRAGRLHLISQSTRPEKRFVNAKQTEGRNIGNLLFEFLFGR